MSTLQHQHTLQKGVCVNVKYTDGNSYAAFISAVNPNGKYRVYFVDDGVRMDNVDHEDISLPIMAGKSSRNASDYEGAVFFDEGGVVDGKFIEKGEFVVKRVATNDNFACTRLGEEEAQEEMFDMRYAIERIQKYENP